VPKILDTTREKCTVRRADLKLMMPKLRHGPFGQLSERRALLDQV